MHNLNPIGLAAWAAIVALALGLAWAIAGSAPPAF